jgi:glycosyltransferase involved in cell wall biosynthesis
MLERGWKVWLVLEKPPERSEWLDRLVEAGVSIEYMPRPRGNFDFSLVREVYKLCKRRQCTIFHCENMHTSPLIGAFLAGAKIRLWTKRSMNLATELCKSPNIRDKISISTRLSAFLTTRVLAVSQKVKDELIDLGASDNKVLVFNNPFVSVKREKLEEAEKFAIRKKYNLSEDDIVIVTIGHTVPVKGWDVLIEAFKIAKSNQPRLKLLLVGSTTDSHERESYRDLKERISKYSLEDDVVFTGYLFDIHEPLRASDVFVLSSRAEGFGNVLLEAIVEKLPCISTDVGIASEVIKNGTNGYITEKNNFVQLSEKILLLAGSDEIRERMSSNTEIPAAIPSWEQYAQRTADLYSTLLDRISE